ncbi:hypothetical protein C7G41_09995 [Bradyrhizobium sp. MOS002]|nr:hypothetical protein C7G41_09995 [Bradyrhizobium sp. MOS002]
MPDGHSADPSRPNCFGIVIASAAKQSRLYPWRDSGLLRCARNDGVAWCVPAGSIPSTAAPSGGRRSFP